MTSNRMHISEIWIYPIKSLPGVSLSTSLACTRGLEFDRRWMLTDRSNRFITLRERPELYDFSMHLSRDVIRVGHPEAASELEIPVNHSTLNPRNVTIWEDSVCAYGVSADADAWFSGILGMEVRLVTFGESSVRHISKEWKTADEEVSFADGYPYLIVSGKSLEEISSRAGREMDVRRFRPNLVIEGASAYDEFLWGRLLIGGAELLGLKPCERCVVTTIDPDSKEKGREPLRSLAGRHVKNRAVFGQHASLIREGIIKVGDEVAVADRKARLYAPL